MYSSTSFRSTNAKKYLITSFTVAKKSFLLGLFEIADEKNMKIDRIFEKLIDQILNINQVSVDNVIIKIQKCFKGDWNFLAYCHGINTNVSNLSNKSICIWCKSNVESTTNNNE